MTPSRPGPLTRKIMQPWQRVPSERQQRQVQLSHTGLHCGLSITGVNIMATQQVVDSTDGLLVQLGCPVEE